MSRVPRSKEKQFARDLFEDRLVEEIFEWIEENLDPDEVFDESVLTDYVRKHNMPSEVYDEEDLATWAKDSGWSPPAED